MKKSKIKLHRPTRDFSFSRFFHPEKSPHTSFVIKDNGLVEFTYKAKHDNSRGHIIWDSKIKGAYIRPKTIPVCN